MRLKTAIFLLLACMTRLWAQEFTYVDWNILRPDTLPVQYTEVIPLDEDYRSFRYEVRLDYPEYVRCGCMGKGLAGESGRLLPSGGKPEEGCFGCGFCPHRTAWREIL